MVTYSAGVMAGRKLGMVTYSAGVMAGRRLGMVTYSAGVMAGREAGGRNVLRWCYGRAGGWG